MREELVHLLTQIMEGLEFKAEYRFSPLGHAWGAIECLLRNFQVQLSEKHVGFLDHSFELLHSL